MRKEKRFTLLFCLFIAVLLGSSQTSNAKKIDAVRGKRYTLTKRHGPWMIMVASFRQPPPDLRTKGMSPKDAADELVFALRKKGVPAYVFSQDDIENSVKTVDRAGRPQRRRFRAQQRAICVLAGNYPSSDDRVAQKTVKYVKKFRPKFLSTLDPLFADAIKSSGTPLRKLANGGVYRFTPGRPGPLSGAFLTVNPALSPEEARQRRDPLLLKLNDGMEYSLLENPGRYTLVVATSYVKSTTKTNSLDFRKAVKKFKLSNRLDESALSAWQLAKTLRDGRVPINTSTGVGQKNFEAYVFHDRFHSIVTVGSFDSPNDPRIAKMQQIFGAKIRTNPLTGKDVLIAEVMTLPGTSTRDGTLKPWIFDPKPRVIKVPKLR